MITKEFFQLCKTGTVDKIYQFFDRNNVTYEALFEPYGIISTILIHGLLHAIDQENYDVGNFLVDQFQITNNDLNLVLWEIKNIVHRTPGWSGPHDTPPWSSRRSEWLKIKFGILL